jgi:GDPmannose 4,6-dehydratase
MEFVTRKITSGLAQIARGSGEVLELGNMDAHRDWGFAGDYVEGMWLMLQQDRADDYVLCTGLTHSVRGFVEHAAKVLGIQISWEGEGEKEVGKDASGKVVVRVNPEYYRPAEVDLLIGDNAKAQKCLGWKPKTSFEELVAMMAQADYDRAAKGRISQ